MIQTLRRLTRFLLTLALVALAGSAVAAPKDGRYLYVVCPGIRDYLEFGVPAVWVVDPREMRIWIYRGSGLEEAAGGVVTVDGTNITIPFSAIFD